MAPPPRLFSSFVSSCFCTPTTNASRVVGGLFLLRGCFPWAVFLGFTLLIVPLFLFPGRVLLDLLPLFSGALRHSIHDERSSLDETGLRRHSSSSLVGHLTEERASFHCLPLFRVCRNFYFDEISVLLSYRKAFKRCLSSLFYAAFSLSLSFTICALLVHGIILSSISLCCIRATSTVARIPENTVYPFFRAHSSTLSSLPIPLCRLFSRLHVSLLLAEHRDSLKLFTHPARGRLWSNRVVGDARDPLGRSSGFPGSFYSGVSLWFKTCNTSLLSQGHWPLSSLDRQIETTIASRQI